MSSAQCPGHHTRCAGFLYHRLFSSQEADFKSEPHEYREAVRCYGAAYSEALHHYYVLMDDLSDTHRQVSTSDTETAVTAEYGLALVEGLAAMHAHWWGAQRLDQIGEPIHGPEVIERFVAIARPGVGHILDCCSDELDPHWRRAIHDIYARHPAALVQRTWDDNGVTLIHGDVNPTNIFVPLAGVQPL